MKRLFIKLLLCAVMTTALISCNNIEDAELNNSQQLINITLSAKKPASVRTEMEGTTPYWSVGDKIGVYTEQVKDGNEYTFTIDAIERTLTTTFTGRTALSNTLYVFYPSKGYNISESGAKCEIPATQNPTTTSFDGAADIMIAKPVTLDAEGKQLSNLEFARMGAIVKVVLENNSSIDLTNQHITSLRMSAESSLAGRVYLDVVNQQLGELYYGKSNSVTANYTETTQYSINGTDATYLIVYPQTIATGKVLSFEAVTEGYTIKKSVTLNKDILFESAKITTLTVSLADEHIVANSTETSNCYTLTSEDINIGVNWSYTSGHSYTYTATDGSKWIAYESTRSSSQSNIQIKKDGNHGYLASPEVDGKITKVVANIKNGAKTNSFIICAGTKDNTIYTSANMEQATIDYTIEIEGDYQQIFIRSNKGALYINSVTIYYE